MQAPDTDDMGKLLRMLGYIRATRERGLKMRIGDKIEVRTYIDASFAVHNESKKSHTGAIVVIGEAATVYARSTKQKIVVKSSTEAELVAMSDALGEALYIANFLRAQGHDPRVRCLWCRKVGHVQSGRSIWTSVTSGWRTKLKPSASR